jgi:hypothetical protein
LESHFHKFVIVDNSDIGNPKYKAAIWEIPNKVSKIPDHRLNQEILDLSMWNERWKVAFEQDPSIGAMFSGKKYMYSDVPFFRRAALRACSYQVF